MTPNIAQSLHSKERIVFRIQSQNFNKLPFRLLFIFSSDVVNFVRAKTEAIENINEIKCHGIYFQFWCVNLTYVLTSFYWLLDGWIDGYFIYPKENVGHVIHLQNG